MTFSVLNNLSKTERKSDNKNDKFVIALKMAAF